MNHRLVLAPVLALCLLTGCAKNTTAPTPAPVQTIAQSNKLLADAANTLVTTVITLRNQGKISAADTTTIENWVKTVVVPTSKAIDAEEISGDTWTVMRTKLLAIITKVTGPAVAQNVDAGAAAAIAAALALVAQIQAAVTQ